MRLQVQRLRCRLGSTELVGRLGIEEQGQPGFVGKRLGQELDLLLCQLQLLEDQSSDVPARPRQAFDVTQGQRIEIDGDHDNRSGAARTHDRLK